MDKTTLEGLRELVVAHVSRQAEAIIIDYKRRMTVTLQEMVAESTRQSVRHMSYDQLLNVLRQDVTPEAQVSLARELDPAPRCDCDQQEDCSACGCVIGTNRGCGTCVDYNDNTNEYYYSDFDEQPDTENFA